MKGDPGANICEPKHGNDSSATYKYLPPQNSPPRATGISPPCVGIKKFTQTMQNDSLTLSLLWFVFVLDYV